MPIAAPSATHGAGPPSVDEADTLPLMGVDALDDEGKFKIYRRVPILDVNEDAERGNVDADMLETIAKNSNARVSGGDPPSLLIGHTKRKTTLIVLRPDGSKVVFPATDEETQPDVVGYSKNHTVGNYKGKPCLYGDFHIHKEHLDKARKCPFRSAERVESVGDDDDSSHYIDRIALLKTPPQRDLGILQYEQSTGGDGVTPSRLRVCYAREFPPLDVDIGQDTKPSGKAPDEADIRAEDGNPAAAAEPANPEPTPMPTPEDTMPQDDMNASDQAAPDDGAAAAPQMPATIGEMAPQDFFEAMAAANAEALRSVLSEHLEEPDADDGAPPPGEGDEGEEHTDYEASDLMDPDASEEDEMRSQYEGGGEAGGDDTFVPGGDGGETCDKKARTMYAKLAKDHGTLAKGQDEANELIVYLSDKLLEMEHKERRHNYSKQLDELTGSGWDINDECKAELLDDLGPDAPDGYESKKLGEIRKYYGRKAIGRPTIPVAHAEVAPPEPAGLTLADRNRAIAYASKHGGTFTDAVKATKV